MDGGTIVGLIIAILMVIAHLVKSVKEGLEARSGQASQPMSEAMDDELVLITQPKMSKSKGNKQRQSERQSPKKVRSLLGDSLSESPQKQAPKQALTKKLSPQGEGERFVADPGTLDTTRIVAPTFDHTVKPELESITGIYEQEATSMGRGSAPAVTLNIADWLAKPEGICQAVILAEILNRPTWEETFTHHPFISDNFPLSVGKLS